MPPSNAYAKWTVPTILLLSILLQRYTMTFLLCCKHAEIIDRATAEYPERIWQTSKESVPIFTGLDDVEPEILGGIDLHLQGTRKKQKGYQAFKWTFIREPSDRAQAEFLRVESVKGQTSTFIKSFKQYSLSSEHLTHYAIKTLHPSGTVKANTTKFDAQIIDILKSYHFIGLVERLEESLVVFKLLLDLEWRDILFLPSNDIFRRNGTTNCVFRIPMFQQIFFLKTQTWKERVRGDEQMYQAVDRSLDLTIDHLGRSLIEKNVEQYQEMLQLAISKCFESTKYACSINGVLNLQNDCINGDNGCGYECLDKIFNKP